MSEIRQIIYMVQFTKYLSRCLVKGEKFCFRYLDFHFQHGEFTSTASLLTSPASQKSHDLNKVSLLLRNLDSNFVTLLIKLKKGTLLVWLNIIYLAVLS